MRLHAFRLLLVLLSAFMVCVLYLNLKLTAQSMDLPFRTNAAPWSQTLTQAKLYKASSESLHSRLFSRTRPGKPLFYKAETFSSSRKISVSVSSPATSETSPKRNNSSARTTPVKFLSRDMYPSLDNYADDRILQQLNFVPQSVQRQREIGQAVKVKKILVYQGTGRWGIQAGKKLFKEQDCTVQDCELVNNHGLFNEVDVVLFQTMPPASRGKSRANQIWAMFALESPHHFYPFSSTGNNVNWTATYRHDSTIVAPYEKYVPFNTSLLMRPPVKNYAEGKTKKVAWFVSNCGAQNRRMEYAHELAEYIQVDIYGYCGKLSCPQFRKEECFKMLSKDYKFYLSFENSNCRDYITEKFYINGLQQDVIPIVMGAAPEDYKRAAPPNSYIHVDDFTSAEALARHLHALDQDDALYNEYFAWKGLWHNINTFFWCRLCALAHDVDARGASWYEDPHAWWDGPGVCIGQRSWREQRKEKEEGGDYAAPFQDLLKDK